ncbi:MAG: M16 family metallopeptidase [Bacteroides sp.]
MLVEPNIEQTTLPSGLRLVFAPSKLLVGFAGIYICAGARDELPTEYGIAHLVEHMYFKGTLKRKAIQVVERVENIGGELNAFTTKEETVIHASFVPHYLGRVLELLADILCHANFPDEELRRERAVVLEEINSYKDDPSELIFDDYEDLLFADTELGHNILGSTYSVRKYKRKDLITYLQRTYGIDRMAVFVTGPFEMKRVVMHAARYFTEIPYGKNQQNRKPVIPTLAVREKRINKHTAQAHCIVGTLAPSVHDDERKTPFRLLTEILAGSATSSLLNKRLRERLGLVYTVEGTYTNFLDTGYLGIYFATSHDQLERCLTIVKEEMERLCTQPISNTLLQKITTRTIGQFWLGNENIENLILTYTRFMLDAIPYIAAPQLLEKWRNIRTEELQTLAKEYLTPEKVVTLAYV